MSIETAAGILARIEAEDAPRPTDSLTWGEWKKLHPLRLYRDREWRREEALRIQYHGKVNPVPSMKALRRLSLRLQNAWTVVWMREQEEEYRKAVGYPSIEEERRQQAINEAQLRQLERERGDEWGNERESVIFRR